MSGHRGRYRLRQKRDALGRCDPAVLRTNGQAGELPRGGEPVYQHKRSAFTTGRVLVVDGGMLLVIAGRRETNGVRFDCQAD